MTPIIAIRPQPGCQATLSAGRALGLIIHGAPLFTVGPLPWDAPDPAEFDALLLGSANALRHAGRALNAYAGKPAYAVGATTAEAARAAGLDVVETGKGGLEAVLPLLRAEHRRLLRLAGRERVPLDLPAGVRAIERLVYAADPLPLPADLRALLAFPSVILLHSAEAARHFAALCDSAAIDRRILSLAALGPRIAAAAGAGWRALKAAETPDDSALLALARRMCQDGDG